MLETIGIIIMLGMTSQWLSWKGNIPVVIILLITGFLAGPVFGILDPVGHLGNELILTIVELSVALILFDGAMQLRMSEFKLVSNGLKRILTLGVIIHFIFLTFSAYYVMGFSIGFSALIGGILIVTGPTVIIPALREVKMTRRVSHFLKWEGILTDPVGAIIAVVVYDTILLSTTEDPTKLYSAILNIILISFAFSFLVKIVLDFALSKKQIPEFLQIPFITSLVMGSFVFSNEIQNGSGLLTVTILGMLIGNSKIEILFDLRTFKENITTMCISFVFIIIASSIPLEVFQMIEPRHIVFVLLVSFVLRIAAIFFSTIKSEMQLRERFLIGSYGPRGIVAASVAAVIGSEMKNNGIEGGEFILPIVFLVILTTVIIHGLMLNPLSRFLKLKSEGNKGVIFIGTMPWVVDLAEKLKALNIPVLVTSASWHKLAPARKRGVEIHYGQIINSIESGAIDTLSYSYLFAMSENDSYNQLACTKVEKYFGKENVFHLEKSPNFVHDQYNVDKNLYCVYVQDDDQDLTFENLIRFHHCGWRFKETRITETYSFQDFKTSKQEQILCLVIKSDGSLFLGSKVEEEPSVGDIVISLAKPDYLKESPTKA